MEWRLGVTRRVRRVPAEPRPLLRELMESSDLARWLDREGIVERTPFLIGPDGVYDVELNRWWRSARMTSQSRHSRMASARDMKTFLAFLWDHRPPVLEVSIDGVVGRPRRWRDATEADWEAFEVWRCDDPAGPRIASTSWNRSVSSVDVFYKRAVRRGEVAANPVPQRASRDRRPYGSKVQDGETADSRRPDGRRGKLQWLPPETYRRWRDVGLRGYLRSGLPDRAFRGRRTARNSTFSDLMIRTGLRLSEQALLSVYELPDHDGVRAYYRFWLPEAIAKGGSARNVYIPDGVLRQLRDYIEIDRADAVAMAQRTGRYAVIEDPLVIEDPTRPKVRFGRRWRDVADLDEVERARLLVRTAQGLEPTMLWLGADGMPLDAGTWKAVFRQASRRCRQIGLRDHHCHPHVLRHSFAVVTLEQLQRTQIEVLSQLTPEQRRHHQMVWGDPLDWVRIRLGHTSLETTQKYLHALREIEMETRLALVPDLWERPDRPYLRDISDAVERGECLPAEEDDDLVGGAR
jgi:site-specific recombinase XerD